MAIAKTTKTRKKAAYRKKTQNRLSMMLISMVVLLLWVTVLIWSFGIKQHIKEKDAQITQLEQSIEAEEKRAEAIKDFEKYTQTKAYMEEVAKDKLGLVYEDEVILKEAD